MAHPSLKGSTNPQAPAGAAGPVGAANPDSLPPKSVAALMVLSGGFPPTMQRIATGLGIMQRESGFSRTARNSAGNSPANSVDRGPWQLNSYWHREVTDQCAFDWLCSTKAAGRISKGGTDWSQWSTYTGSSIGTPFLNDAKDGIAIAQAVKQVGSSGDGPLDAILQGATGAAGAATGAIGSIIDAGADVVDFVGDFVATVLNFRKLGELMAKVFAWFLKLVARAIWEYMIAPVFHWNERAVTYYWQTYMVGSGDKDSKDGLGRYSLGITIFFWGLGWAILFAKAEPKLGLSAPANETPLGRMVRSSQSQVARRNLTKPDKAKDKTPIPPKPESSDVALTRTRTLAATRRRPVTVSSTSTERTRTHGESGQPTERNHGRRGRQVAPRPIPSQGNGQRTRTQNVNVTGKTVTVKGNPPKQPAESRRAKLGPRGSSPVDSPGS